MGAAQIASIGLLAVIAVIILALLAMFVAAYVGTVNRYLPPEPRADACDPRPTVNPLALWIEIEKRARLAAREDFAAGPRRRPNPYPRHSREFACWAIAYGDAWLDLEQAAFPAGPTPDLS